MIIRKAVREDSAAIIALQRLAYQSEAVIYNDNTIFPLVQTLDHYEAQFDQAYVLVLEENGEMIGSVQGVRKDPFVEIGKLMVHPDHQNKGIGKKLMTAIEQACPSRCYRLFTGSKSEKNLAFYQKLGYEIYEYKTLPREKTPFAFMEKCTG